MNSGAGKQKGNFKDSYGNPKPVQNPAPVRQPPASGGYPTPGPAPDYPSRTVPSTSPYSPPSYTLSSEDPGYRSHEFLDKTGRRHRYETFQDRILNVFGGIFRGIWRHSSTVVRADLVRPYNPKLAKLEGEEENWERQQRGVRRRKRMRGQGWEAIDGYMGGMVQGLDRGFYGNGAQLKLMQIWDFKDKYGGEATLPWDMNFGVGANFDLDNARMQLKTRIRSKHVVMRVLPRPDLELKGRWRLGNSRIGIDVRYRIPVQAPEQMLESGPGGYLSVRLFNWEGSGFSLSPDGGLEFDEQVVRWGRHTKFRVGARLTFPRYFPLDEDEEPLSIEFRRLGFKTVLS